MGRGLLLSDVTTDVSASEGEDLLDGLLEASAKAEFDEQVSSGAGLFHGAFVGTVIGRDAAGQLVVQIDEPARTFTINRATVSQELPPSGSQVVLLFERGDPARPVLVGVLRSLTDDVPAADSRHDTSHPVVPVSAIVDDERIVIQAQREIVLQCGKSSITLTRAGKVLLRGAYVSSRSSGVNRIKGGSVQIN